MSVKAIDHVNPRGYVKIYALPSWFTYQDYLALQNNDPNQLKKYLVDEGDNTITTLGFNIIPIVMSGGVNTITHCAVGTGSPSSTALGTEVGTRVGVTYKYAIFNEFHVDTYYGKNDPNASSNILTETGLFNQLALGGEMYSSKTISFTKSTSVTMVIAWSWLFA